MLKTDALVSNNIRRDYNNISSNFSKCFKYVIKAFRNATISRLGFLLYRQSKWTLTRARHEQ